MWPYSRPPCPPPCRPPLTPPCRPPCQPPCRPPQCRRCEGSERMTEIRNYTYLRTYRGNNHWQVRSRYWDRNCIQEMFLKGKQGRESGSEGWLRKGSKVVDPPASLFLTVVSAELESYALKWGSVRHFHWTKLNDTVRKWWERAKIYGRANVREEITTWCKMQT